MSLQTALSANTKTVAPQPCSSGRVCRGLYKNKHAFRRIVPSSVGRRERPCGCPFTPGVCPPSLGCDAHIASSYAIPSSHSTHRPTSVTAASAMIWMSTKLDSLLACYRTQNISACFDAPIFCALPPNRSLGRTDRVVGAQAMAVAISPYCYGVRHQAKKWPRSRKTLWSGRASHGRPNRFQRGQG